MLIIKTIDGKCNQHGTQEFIIIPKLDCSFCPLCLESGRYSEVVMDEFRKIGKRNGMERK